MNPEVTQNQTADRLDKALQEKLWNEVQERHSGILWAKFEPQLLKCDRSITREEFASQLCEEVLTNKALQTELKEATNPSGLLYTHLLNYTKSIIREIDKAPYYHKRLENLLVEHSSKYVKVGPGSYSLPRFAKKPVNMKYLDQALDTMSTRGVRQDVIPEAQIHTFLTHHLTKAAAPLPLQHLSKLFMQSFGIALYAPDNIELLISNLPAIELLSGFYPNSPDELVMTESSQSELSKSARKFIASLSKVQLKDLHCYSTEFHRAKAAIADCSGDWGTDWSRIGQCMKSKSQTTPYNRIYKTKNSLLLKYFRHLAKDGFDQEDIENGAVGILCAVYEGLQREGELS